MNILLVDTVDTEVNTITNNFNTTNKRKTSRNQNLRRRMHTQSSLVTVVTQAAQAVLQALEDGVHYSVVPKLVLPKVPMDLMPLVPVTLALATVVQVLGLLVLMDFLDLMDILLEHLIILALPTVVLVGLMVLMVAMVRQKNTHLKLLYWSST